jgi:predicted amidohydrolase YtcJ
VIGESGRGRIEAGKTADVIVLDDQLMVQLTIVEGVLTYCRPEFSARITTRESGSSEA